MKILENNMEYLKLKKATIKRILKGRTPEQSFDFITSTRKDIDLSLLVYMKAMEGYKLTPRTIEELSRAYKLSNGDFTRYIKPRPQNKPITVIVEKKGLFSKLKELFNDRFKNK